MFLLTKKSTRNKVYFINEDTYVSVDKIPGNQQEIGSNLFMKMFMSLLTKKSTRNKV